MSPPAQKARGSDLGSSHHHMADSVILAPEAKLRAKSDRHVIAKRIQGLWPVDQDKAYPAMD